MRLAPILLVLGFFIFLSVFKFTWSVSLPQFDYQDDTGYYFSEAAFHYRYAKMVAFGKPIPVIDYQAQYPEGVGVFQQFTLLSEYAYGLPYKMLSLQRYVPFHVYLLFVISFFSSLNIFVIFFLALSLWKNYKSALFASTIFGTAIPSFERTIGWYGYEDFAFFFIFMSLFFFIKKQKVAAYLSAILLCVALAGWHLTPFYIVILSVAVLAMYLFSYPSASNSIGRITILYFFLFVTGLLFPVLRQKSFITSPGMLIFLSLLIMNFIVLKFHLIQKRLVFGIFLIILLILFFFSHTCSNFHPDDFSHIYNLIKAKILFFGFKPDNPSLIPFETRVYWVGPYNNPTLQAFIRSFFPHVLLTFTTLFSLMYFSFKRKKNIRYEILFICFFLVLAGTMYVFFIRMRSFFVFFTALVAGGSLYLLDSDRLLKKRVSIILILLIACFHMTQFVQKMPDFRILKPSVLMKKKADLTSSQQLVFWIKRSIPPKSVILTPFIGLGSDILAYTDSSVVIHSQFEEKAYRKKYQDIIISIFDDQESFYMMCKRLGVDFVIFAPTIIFSTDKDSLRYETVSLNILNEHSFPFLYYRKNLRSPYFSFVGTVGGYDVYKIVQDTK